MMSDSLAPQPGLSQQRDRVVERLIEQFSRDSFGVEELERRIDAAHRASTPDELRGIVSDLPVPAETPRRPAPAPAERRDSDFTLAIMGGTARVGRWVPPRKLHGIAFWGGLRLDFRDAPLPPGETTVVVVALMGGVEIIVPPDVRVVCDGIGIMGGFDQSGSVTPPPEDAPVLRIQGLALMGGVGVETRLPGESRSEAKRRLREERRERRRLR